MIESWIGGGRGDGFRVLTTGTGEDMLIGLTGGGEEVF